MCMSILAQRVASADEPLSLLRLGARPGEIRAFPGWSSLLPCTASKLVQAKDRAGALERVPLATLRCSCSCSCLLVLRLVTLEGRARGEVTHDPRTLVRTSLL